MTTTLSEGVKVPDVGSTDWADDLETNWNLLNTALAQQGSWAKVDEAQTFTGVQTFSDGIVGSLQGTANMAMSDADGNTITSTYATKTELSTLSTTVGTKADDADVVHKADAETITGAKTFNATVTSADVVPSATDTYSLGSASYQYNAVYGKSYYYNGTQWGLDQVNTWSEVNTFSKYQIFQVGAYFYNSDSTAATSGLNLRNSKVTKGGTSDNGSQIIQFLDKDNKYLSQITTTKALSGTTQLKFTLGNIDGNSNSITGDVTFSLAIDGTKQFLPGSNNTHALGNSSYKWATLNGINPGALSLPNLDSYSDITSDFTANLDKTQTEFSWTSSYTGWLHVMWFTRGVAEPYWVDVWTVPTGATNTGINYSNWGQIFSQPSSAWWVPTYFPVVAGKTYYFARNWVRSTNDSTTHAVVAYARFIPTLGNV